VAAKALPDCDADTIVIGGGIIGVAIAAVLRTVVTHLAYKDSEGREFIYVPDLISIAAELEGVNG
jgi:hypothetical protein